MCANYVLSLRDVNAVEEKKVASASVWPGAVAVAVVGWCLRVGALAVHTHGTELTVRDALLKWDAQHYIVIASAGYVREESHAFFPGLPLLMRALQWVGVANAGMLISAVATVFLAAGVMALARRMGADQRGQIAAAFVVTCAPMCVVFAMPYTEALFGALAVWAIVAMVDARWLRAGLLIFALGFVRLTAVDMVATFAIIVALRARRDWKAWAAVVVSALPVLGFLGFANSRLDKSYFELQKEHWNSGFDLGLATLRWVWDTLSGSDNVGYLLSTLVIVGAPVMVFLAWHRLPLPAWLFSALLVANVLLSDGLMHSRPRLLLAAALLFMPWAIDAAKRERGWVLIGAWCLFGVWFSSYMLVVFEWAI